MLVAQCVGGARGEAVSGDVVISVGSYGFGDLIALTLTVAAFFFLLGRRRRRSQL